MSPHQGSDRRRNVLLLTATITPAAVQPSLAIRDPEERLAEYRQALAFYADLLDGGSLDAIVFGENSGHDLTTLARQFPQPGIEWISVPPEALSQAFHRGHAEFQLIDAMFQRSSTLANLGWNDLVWKVSGRYVVGNLARVMRWAPRRVDLYCSADRRWVEMSILAWSAEGYRGLVRGLCDRFRSTEAPELIFRRCIDELAQGSLKQILSFHWPARVFGRRGTDGGQFEGRRTRYRFALVATWKALVLPWRRWRNV